MKHSHSSHSPAFTIVELLVVIVIIAILATITIVNYNGATDKAKESVKLADLSQWKTKSELYKVEHGIECPTNYSFVYGNTTLGTSDFCVMKYEAKIQGNDNGQTAYASSMVADSRATGTPWVNITQTNAITEATEIGGHLLTEAEWMTIAADVLSVKYNWSGGVVGSGFIYSGHNDYSPASGLVASTDDADGYSGTGNSISSGDNQKRILYLTSGDIIWDFSGNVWEWTQQAIGTPALTVSNIGVSGDSGFNWRDYTNGSLSLGNLATVSKPATLNSWTNPVNKVSLSGITWNASKGVGQIYANYSDTGFRAFLRGGSLGDGTSAGVLTLHLGIAPSEAYPGVGFRVAW